MLKAMMFIDGSWFDLAVESLCYRRGVSRLRIKRLQFEPIWDAVKRHISASLKFDVDLVRVYCAAGYPDPDTVGEVSVPYAERIAGDWEALRAVPCMTLDLYPYHYRGKEFKSVVPREDSSASDDASHKEKCVDVALATRMLYFAAIPSAYDVAILLSGDRDYIPVLRAVRGLGKRTMLASVPEVRACAAELTSDRALGDLWDIPHLDLGPVVNAQLSTRTPQL